MPPGRPPGRARRKPKWRLREPSPEPCGLTPVNVVIWAMKKLCTDRGVTMRKMKALIKTNFVLPCEGRDVDTRIGSAVRQASDFGILERRGTLYYFKRSWLRRVRVEDERKVDKIINEVECAIMHGKRSR